jgi:tetratricopeptide (TPR) repeat protein
VFWSRATSWSVQASPSGSARAAASIPPLPTIGKPDAIAAYRDAIVAFRDGRPSYSESQLGKALEIDPDFAPALVRLAVLRMDANEGAEVTNLVARARALRGTLAGRDLVLFGALEARMASDPPDRAAFVRILDEYLAREPNDVDMRVRRAQALSALGRHAETVAECGRALEIDPGFAAAFALQGLSARWNGDHEESQRIFDRCVRELPMAASCMVNRGGAKAADGACAEAMADARRAIALDPSERSYNLLAKLLAAEGASEGTVRSALDQAFARAPIVDHVLETEDRALLALWAGRFDEADGILKKLTDEQGTRLQDMSRWLRARAVIAEEVGDKARLAAAARAMIAHEPVLPGLHQLWHGWALRTLVMAGAIDRPTFDRKVQTFRDRLPKLLADNHWGMDTPRSRTVAWDVAWMETVLTPGDAKEALRQRAVFHVAPHEEVYEFTSLGETLLLAGETDKAIEPLRRAAGCCDMLERFEVGPVPVVLASELLGEALQERGDTAGACAAYARVLARWGGAKSSVTAAKARTRAAGLGCPK